MSAPPVPPAPVVGHHAAVGTLPPPVDPRIAADAEAARRAGLIAQTAPAKPLTVPETYTRIREQLAWMKNPNNTSDMTFKGCERIEALLDSLPVVK